MVQMIKFTTQFIHCSYSNGYFEDPIVQFNRWVESNKDKIRIINTFFTTMEKDEIVVATYEDLTTSEQKEKKNEKL